ncbi:ATP-binding protein [Streptomyces sp. CB04723]|uniref:ATP-binding protein n=1 Tax=Streptomyces TaxID=1883 RepID=UPI0015C4C349|nr:ATP-binding protein [Streptomyces sp. CB04723]QLG33771.1 ATP-binding protein [Streptomyces sp. CB04723]
MWSMHHRALPPKEPTGPVPPQLVCAAEPESVRAARRFVREAAAYQRPETPEDALGTLELLASELATNAIVHGRPSADASIRVVVDARPGRTRIEVHDSCTRAPYVRPVSTLSERGRGLLLVRRLAASWGYVDRLDSKYVWTAVTW